MTVETCSGCGLEFETDDTIYETTNPDDGLLPETLKDFDRRDLIPVAAMDRNRYLYFCGYSCLIWYLDNHKEAGESDG